MAGVLFLFHFTLSCMGQSVTSFSLGAKIHIRALEVLNDSTVFFGANRGIWGFTRNGGKTWKVDSINVGGKKPQFRSVALINDSTAFLLCIDSPAILLKTTDSGMQWKTVYRDDRAGIFFDCLVFRDEKSGYALADPIDSCFQIISTEDGGESWSRLPCSALPKAHQGEACFAASNSNMAVRSKHVWFVTGGKQSRLFHSSDGGARFKATQTPLPSGETMTGIYSVDFFDEERGAIAGGHYERSDITIVCLAVTKNGGKSWKVVRPNKPFFGSCVRFLSTDRLVVTGHNGTFTIGFDDGKTAEITGKFGEQLNYYTLRLSPDRKCIWMAGSDGRLAKMRVN